MELKGWLAAIFSDDLWYPLTCTKWLLLSWAPHESSLSMGKPDFTTLAFQGQLSQYQLCTEDSNFRCKGHSFSLHLKKEIIIDQKPITWELYALWLSFFFFKFHKDYWAPLMCQTHRRPSSLTYLHHLFLAATSVGILMIQMEIIHPFFEYRTSFTQGHMANKRQRWESS